MSDLFVQHHDDIEYELDKYIHSVVNVPSSILLPDAPTSISHALSMPEPENILWWESMMKEFENLDSYGTFGEASQDGHAMKTKLIFTTTFKNDYSIKRKTRLVTCGYSQMKGRDFNETYAPTTSTLIINIILSIAGQRDLFVSNFDVTAAFLEGDNDYVQYCRLPADMCENERGRRVQILKSLYGEKQAPKIWSDRLSEILLEIGFKRCPVEPCLYTWEHDNEYIYIAIHVDDGLMVATNEKLFRDFMEIFHTHIKKAELFYPVQKYLGMNIDDTHKHKIILSQYEYVNDMKLYESVKATAVPMTPSINLRIELPNLDNES